MVGMSDQSTQTETAIVFVSHTAHKSVIDRFRKLKREARPQDDVYFLYDVTDATSEDQQRAQRVAEEQLRSFVQSHVTDIDYINPWADPTRQGLVPGNVDLLFLYFSQIEPKYSYYWFIEYDVAYTGTWSRLFQAFENSTADIIGTTLYSYEYNPDWHWWQSLETVPEIDRSQWHRGFFPIIRLSQKMLDLVDQGYQDGWSGHAETVLPTLACYRGLDIEDIGGNGPYVRENNLNRFYTNCPDNKDLSPGTFIYRPARPQPGLLSGKLWHPVKPNCGFVLPYLRLTKDWVKNQVLTR